MIKPITPKEVQGKKNAIIPDQVVQAVNELIVENWSADSKSAEILMKEIVSRAKKLGHKVNYEKNELDFEPLFRAAGWKVKVDSPGYCETYETSFEFKK